MKTRAAKTFTCSYDQKEDRIRLVLNYQEHAERVDFWITRSFLLRLLPLLSKFGSSHNEMSLISDNSSNDTRVNEQTSIPTDESMMALTQKEPVLLERVDFGKNDGVVNIVFSTPDLDKYAAALRSPEVDALADLLIRTAPTYDWGIGPWWGGVM